MLDRLKLRCTGRRDRIFHRRHGGIELLEDRRVLAVSFSEAIPLLDSNSVYPKSIVAADFDGDNDADIAIAVLGDDQISWMENLDGQGTYGEPQVLTTTAIGASSVFAADLDGDGDWDLLSASSSRYDSDVSWYENLDGRGTFSDQKVISADIQTGDSVHAADLDGDGDMDVLSASRSDNKVAWYENLDGQGDFSDQVIISDASEGATTVVAADLDGDGDVDVVAGSAYDDTVAWFENDGNAEFDEHVVSEVADFVTAVATGDIDNDGDLDIISASREDDTISWYSNDDGTFGPERIITVDENGPNELFIGDFDGDSHLDVVSASRSADRVAWYRNDGRGVFEAPRVISEATNGASAVYGVDVDGDQDLDLFSTSRFDNKVAMYENLDGLGQFGPQQLLTAVGAPGVQFTTAADIDGDGDNDVLTAVYSVDQLLWQENTGAGSFGPPQLISDRMAGTDVVVTADFDGDGDLDAASGSFRDSRIAWYENDGQGSFGVQRVISTDAIAPDDLHAADVDGDGDIDLLSASRGDDTVAWYDNTDGFGTFSTQKVISTTQDAPSFVRTADLDGDGDLDVLASAYSDGTAQDWSLSWYPNDGTGNFGVEQIITTDLELPTSFDTADLDGDGDLDVVSTSGRDDKVAWYENTNGGGSFSDPLVISAQDTADGAFYVDAVDIDADGDPDLVTVSYVDDTVGWYENTNGQAAFGPLQVISTAANGPTSVIATDLNGDGHLDVLVASSGSDSVIWFRNTSEGSPSPGDFNGDLVVDAADIDLLCQQIHSGDFDANFDLTEDGSLSDEDVDELVLNILDTDYGDANLDGIFDTGDFVQVFTRGQYEDGIEANSGWADGDWNCDLEFSTTDLVTAFQAGGFVAASRPTSTVAASPAGADFMLNVGRQPVKTVAPREWVADEREVGRPRQIDLQDIIVAAERTSRADAPEQEHLRLLSDSIDAALGEL